jgi:hypothetical protein
MTNNTTHKFTVEIGQEANEFYIDWSNDQLRPGKTKKSVCEWVLGMFAAGKLNELKRMYNAKWLDVEKEKGKS